MKMDQIEKLVKLVQNSDLNELYWSEGDKKLVLKKGGAVGPVIPVMSPAPQAAAPAPAPAAPAPGAAEPAPQAAPAEDGKEITSPMVGTFYSASSPDAPPFVKVGDTVSKGQVLCIIEAMKLMNEIESEVSGVVKEICVDNETPVEFGTVLFKIA